MWKRIEQFFRYSIVCRKEEHKARRNATHPIDTKDTMTDIVMSRQTTTVKSSIRIDYNPWYFCERLCAYNCE